MCLMLIWDSPHITPPPPAQRQRATGRSVSATAKKTVKQIYAHAYSPPPKKYDISVRQPAEGLSVKCLFFALAE